MRDKEKELFAAAKAFVDLPDKPKSLKDWTRHYDARERLTAAVAAIEEAKAPEHADKLLTAVLAVFTEELGVSVGAIMGRARTRRVSRARQMVCFVLRQAGLSFPEIGRVMGLDHSTVQHACRRIGTNPFMNGVITTKEDDALSKALKAIEVFQ